MRTRLAIKEWAGVINALGQGDQIILIRKYSPDAKQFLLYPTYSYYNTDRGTPERFEAKFQSKFLTLARESALSELENPGIVNLRYVFEVDKVVNIPQDTQISRLVPFMIWSAEHVATYAEKAYNGLNVWIGRAKRLPVPVLAARQTSGGSITTYKHFEDIDIGDALSVLSESDYEKKRKELMTALGEKSRVDSI